MFYFDTSFLAPLILEESASSRVEAYLRTLPAGEPALSTLTRLEFSSLLAREVRMDGLRERDALAAEDMFDAMVRDAFIVLHPTPADFGLASKYIQHYATGLRTADALHLAIARNNGAERLLSLDNGLLKAAWMVGVPAGEGGGGGAGKSRVP